MHLFVFFYLLWYCFFLLLGNFREWWPSWSSRREGENMSSAFCQSLHSSLWIFHIFGRHWMAFLFFYFLITQFLVVSPGIARASGSQWFPRTKGTSCKKMFLIAISRWQLMLCHNDPPTIKMLKCCLFIYRDHQERMACLDTLDREEKS